MIDWQELAEADGFPNDKELLKARYAEMKSSRKVGAHLGISGKAVIDRLKYHKIKSRSRGGANNLGVRENSLKVRLSKYPAIVKSMTSNQVCESFGCSLSHFYKVAKDNGIEYAHDCKYPYERR